MIDISTQFTQIALGIDRLYRTQANNTGFLEREGLAAVNLSSLPPFPFSDWLEADKALAGLAERLPEEGDPLQRDYLQEMTDSLRGLVAVFRDQAISYPAQVERCLRVSPQAVSAQTMAAYQQKAADLLRQLGYGSGSLAQQIEQWELARQVAPADVPRVLAELIDAARRRTEKFLFPLSLEPVKVEGLPNVPFSAYCDYPGRKILINPDYLYTRSALKHLACHEAFPGHFVHLAVREQRSRAGLMPPDSTLVITNTANSSIFEGISENGIYFLDWIEDLSDELAMVLNRLRSAGRINAALMIHRDGKPPAEAGDYLRQTCFVNTAWVESRLAFVLHPLRAPFIFAYWYGDMAVGTVWEQVESHQRSTFFQYLYHHMHTATTLAKYWPGYLRMTQVAAWPKDS